MSDGGALLLAAVLGYGVGALSPATVAARLRGVDLRAGGSGNPGAANAGRLLGRRTGALVALLDVLKGLLPTVLLAAQHPQAGRVAGVAAVLGHVTSPLLRGRGGKGVATAAGAVLGAQPLWAPVVVAVWLVVLGASRWIALSSVCAALALLGLALATGQDRLWAGCLAAVVVVRHRRNFVRGGGAGT